MNRIIDHFKPKDKNKDEFRYKRIFRAKDVYIDEDNVEGSVYAAVKQIVREMLEVEKQIRIVCQKDVVD